MNITEATDEGGVSPAEPDGGPETEHLSAAVTNLGHGYYNTPATVGNGELLTHCPCHKAIVRIPIPDLEVLGEVTVRCPRSGALFDVRHDPWAPLGARPRAVDRIVLRALVALALRLCGTRAELEIVAMLLRDAADVLGDEELWSGALAAGGWP